MLLGIPVFAQVYPTIEPVNEDQAFGYQQQSLQAYYRSEVGRGSMPELSLFTFLNQNQWDLLGLSARFQLTVETIGSLNGIDNQNAPLPGQILIPNLPGIFVPDVPRNPLDELSRSRFIDSPKEPVPLVLTTPDGKKVPGSFYPGERYSTSERMAFVRPLFQSPLRGFRVTASFGIGPDPFTLRVRSHQGIDLVPISGNKDVYPAARGRIVVRSTSPVYGNYLIVLHNDMFSSLYAHLSDIYVLLGQEVEIQTPLGAVGTTGLSTGPHLHFELLRRNLPINPTDYIPDLRHR
ncbi:MAG: M23 family metallopeptidase [Spirochaetales bacterium]|nr:M23 family metallopeptidase [Spirochaetales bacterium]